jgi:hypothetical protein
MPVFGILSLREFIVKYKLSKKQESELVAMQAFHQGIGMLIGAGGLLIFQIILSLILPG